MIESARHPGMIDTLKEQISQQGKTLLIALRHPGLPLLVKVALWSAFVYFVCPVDLRPDFLPDGFSDDSVVTPLLVLLGLLCIPFRILKEASHIAKGVTCNLLCVALFGTTVVMPVQASVSSHCGPFVSNAKIHSNVSNQNNKQWESNLSVVTVEGIEDNCSTAEITSMEDTAEIASAQVNDAKTISEAQSVSYGKFIQDHDSVLSEAGQKRQVNHLCLPRTGIHGNQLRLYSSGDEAEPALAMSPQFNNICRPPCIKKRGGLFRALKSCHLRFRHQQTDSRRKISLPLIAYGLVAAREDFHSASYCKPAIVSVPVKLWLCNKALLL